VSQWADFNGDGKLDLAVVNDLSDTLNVLLNNGNGTFAAKTDYSVGEAPLSVIQEISMGNGKADLAVVNTKATP